MRDLRTCMHARIRASGALYQYLISRQRLNCRGQNTLHGDLVSLNLPAGKRRAVIFDDKLVAGHRFACDHRVGPGDPVNTNSTEVTRCGLNFGLHGKTPADAALRPTAPDGHSGSFAAASTGQYRVAPDDRAARAAAASMEYGCANDARGEYRYWR